MKTIKPFIFYTVAGALCFVPTFAFAKEVNRVPQAGQLGAFCDRIKDIEQKAQTDADELVQKITTEGATALATLEEKWKAQDSATKKDRIQADAVRLLEQKRSVKKFSKKQQEAAILFNNKVENSIKERRNAADKEVQEYRDGVTTLLEKRKGVLKDLGVAYKNGTTKAVAIATNTCKNKNQSNTAQKQFNAQMKIVTDTFKKKYKETSVSSQIEALAKKEGAELEKITGESKQKLINAKEGFSVSISQEHEED